MTTEVLAELDNLKFRLSKIKQLCDVYKSVKTSNVELILTEIEGLCTYKINNGKLTNELLPADYFPYLGED